MVDQPLEHAFDWWTDPFGLCVFLQPRVGFMATPQYLTAPNSTLAQESLASVRAKAKGRRCIGINWHSDMLGGSGRSVPFVDLVPLLMYQDVHWVILQRGDALFDLHSFGLAEQCSIITEQASYDDTAAIVSGLDAVLTIDCYMLHLAGAVGQKVYFMAGRNMDWRHMNEETQSLWYPNTQLVRQPELGDWASVVQNVLLKLKDE